MSASAEQLFAIASMIENGTPYNSMTEDRVIVDRSLAASLREIAAAELEREEAPRCTFISADPTSGDSGS